VHHAYVLAQRLGGITLHHRLRQLVLDLPGRGLRHAEATSKFNAGEASGKPGAVHSTSMTSIETQLG